MTPDDLPLVTAFMLLVRMGHIEERRTEKGTVYLLRPAWENFVWVCELCGVSPTWETLEVMVRVWERMTKSATSQA